MATATLWWAAAGMVDNHNYVLDGDGNQRCHLCNEVEPKLRRPSGDERTDRAAMHLVHGVDVHLNATTKEWNQQGR